MKGGFHLKLAINLRLIKNQYGDNSFIAVGEDEDFKCFQCLTQIEEGYICETTKKVLCVECQNKFNMGKCKHDKFKEHKHIKFLKENENI